MPSTMTLPLSIFSRWLIHRNSVDFPRSAGADDDDYFATVYVQTHIVDSFDGPKTTCIRF